MMRILWKISNGMICLIAIAFGFYFALHLLGYYPDGLGWQVAKEIVATSKNPRDCYKIIHPIPHIFSPSFSEQRGTCLYTYASLTLDPSACELLLPSEYGLACLSNLWPDALGDNGCGWSVDNPKIFQCRQFGGPLYKSSNCSDFRGNTKHFSACIAYTASRERKLEKCYEATDPIIRSLCIAEVNAWNTYPQLRNSFYFGNSQQ